MLDPVPWLIGGGAVHSAEVSRGLAYAATGGVSGVVEAEDLRVEQLTTPGAGVTVSGGGFAIKNTYPGQTSQSYLGRNVGLTTVAVPPTAGAARSDLLIARIDDPQYGGATPPSIQTGPYVKFQLLTNVGNVTKLPVLAYPAIALARIDMPANAATVTQSMIVPLRKVVQPKFERALRNIALVSGDTETLDSTVGEAWPNAGAVYIDIPDYATQMQVRVDWAQVLFPPGSTYGSIWMEFGPFLGGSNWKYSTQYFSFDSPNASGNSRTALLVVDTRDVPADIRGTRQRFVPKGKINGGAAGARPVLTGASGIAIDVTFNEIPV